MAKKHSNVMGGSTAERRINCPGSYQAEKDSPDQGESTYAIEGSAIHDAMEAIHDGEVEVEEDVIGQSYYGGTKITSELYSQKVEPALDAFYELVETEFDNHITSLSEVEVTFAPDAPQAFGTTDIIGVNEANTLGLVLDWKFGDGIVVDIEESVQNLFYAAGAVLTARARTHKGLSSMFEKLPDAWLMAIIQPRRGAPGEDPLTYIEVSLDELEQFAGDVVVPTVTKILTAKRKLPRKAGKWCRFCRAASTCPKTKAAMTEVEAFTGELALEKMGDAWELCKIVEGRIRSMRATIEHALSEGHEVPGLKLVAKKGRRRPIDAEAFEKKVKRKLGATKAYDKVLKSITALEKEMGKKAFSEAFGDSIHMVSSGTTVAPESDSRPSVGTPSQELGDLLRQHQEQEQEKAKGNKSK